MHFFNVSAQLASDRCPAAFPQFSAWHHLIVFAWIDRVSRMIGCIYIVDWDIFTGYIGSFGKLNIPAWIIVRRGFDRRPYGPSSNPRSSWTKWAENCLLLLRQRLDEVLLDELEPLQCDLMIDRWVLHNNYFGSCMYCLVIIISITVYCLNLYIFDCWTNMIRWCVTRRS